MKKGLMIVFVFCFLISVSFVSAGFFEDLLKFFGFSKKEIDLGPTNGLVAHYEFEDNTEDSVGNFDGTLVSGATFGSGKVGNKALKLDGIDDYVAFPDEAFFLPSSGLTLSAWVRLEKGGGVIFWENDFQLHLVGSNELKPELRFWSSDNNKNDVISTVSVNLNEWNHVAVVYDGEVNGVGKAKVYVNGINTGLRQVSLGEAKGNPQTNRKDLRLGVDESGGSSNFGIFKGKIDDFRIYDRPLIKSEIGELAGIQGNGTLECSDSDNGKNYAIKGNVITDDGNGVTESVIDTCAIGSFLTIVESCNGEECFLKENYCENEMLKTEIVICDNCNDGACINDTIMDTESLVAHYEFESNAQDSKGNFDGTLRQGTVFGDGKVGNKAAMLDGINDYLEFPDNAFVLPSDGLTLSAWIYPERSKGVIFWENDFQLHLAGSNGLTPELRFWDIDGVLNKVLSPISLNLNEWSHIAIVYEGDFEGVGKARIFLNGVKKKIYSISKGQAKGNPQFNRKDLRLGVDETGGTSDFGIFKGRIDEFKIYNNPLSARSIANLAGVEFIKDTELNCDSIYPDLRRGKLEQQEEYCNQCGGTIEYCDYCTCLEGDRDCDEDIECEGDLICNQQDRGGTCREPARNISEECVQSTEICDGIDNNCNNLIDENVKKVFYVDSDGDGFGNSSSQSIEACTAPEGYAPNSLDCNDADASLGELMDCNYNGESCGTVSICVSSCPVPPQEDCGDDIDENCDGVASPCTVVIPVINLSAPKNNETYKNRQVLLKFEALNAFGCWYVINNKNRTNSDCNVSKGLNLSTGNYNISVFANNSAGLVVKSANFSVLIDRKIRIKYDEFKESNSTTDLDNLTDIELGGVDDLTLETKYGKILFLEEINLTKGVNPSDKVINLDTVVEIGNNSIEIESDVADYLEKEARLFFYNLEFDEPIVLVDDRTCNDCRVLRHTDNRIEVSVNNANGIYMIEEDSSPNRNGNQNPTPPQQPPNVGRGDTPGGDLPSKPSGVGDDDDGEGPNTPRIVLISILIAVIILIILILVVYLLKKNSSKKSTGNRMSGVRFAPQMRR